LRENLSIAITGGGGERNTLPSTPTAPSIGNDDQSGRGTGCGPVIDPTLLLRAAHNNIEPAG
jgi:hypothetical protein